MIALALDRGFPGISTYAKNTKHMKFGFAETVSNVVQHERNLQQNKYPECNLPTKRELLLMQVGTCDRSDLAWQAVYSTLLSFE